MFNLTAKTPRIELLRSEVPNREVNNNERKEIENIFTFDLADASRLFQSSRWTIGKDEFFFSPSDAFFDDSQTSQPPNFLLTGTVQTVGKPAQQGYELHAQNRTPSGSVFTLDVIVRKTTEGHFLNGIYSFSLRGFLQIGRIALELEGELSQPPNFTMADVSEPITVAGISLPSTYAVTLSGTVSGQTFSGVSGILTLTADPKSDKLGIHIDLMSGGIEPRTGDIQWNSSNLFDDRTMTSEVRIGSERQLVHHLKSNSDHSVSSSWFDSIVAIGDISIPSMVSITDGTLKLSLIGEDGIQGEIRATGKEISGEESGEYYALFEGKRTTLPEVELNDPFLLTDDHIQYVEGVPIPSVFDLELSGTVDDTPFGPIPGELMINNSDSGNENLSLMFLTGNYGALEEAGNISWVSADDGLQQIQVSDGRIGVTLSTRSADLQMGLPNWGSVRTKGGEYQGEVTPATAETVAMEFTIDGERLQGKILADGFLLADTSKSSTYQATIRGRLRRQELVDEVRTNVGIVPLSGEWQSDSVFFDLLVLNADGDKRSGRFGSNAKGVIKEGTFAQNMLSFSWYRDDKKGWGFLRPIGGGGKAVGLWGEHDDRTNATPLIAEQPLGPLHRLDPKSPSELRQLNEIGRDLADQGKCGQALPLLQRALATYKARWTERETANLDTQNSLIGVLQIIQPMLDCTFELGDYPAQVTHLRDALEIQRRLTPRESAKRLFEAQADKLIGEFRSTIKTIGILDGNLVSLQKLLEEAGVGITFKPHESTGDVLVEGLMAGGPAERAGIREDDVITAIDGQAIANMDAEELAHAFTGEEGSRVRLTILRGDESHEVDIIRSTLTSTMSTERKQQIHDFHDQLRDNLAGIRRDLEDDISALERADTAIASGQQHPALALEGLIERLQTLRDGLNSRISRLIEQGEAAFGDWEPIIAKQRTLLSVLSAMANGEGKVGMEFRELDALENGMLEELGDDPAISSMEAGLFFEHYKILAIFFQKTHELSLALKTALKDLNTWKASNYDTRTKDTIEQLARLSERLERWRARMNLDSGKIWVLEQGKGFFEDWVGLLWDLGAHKEALVAAEAARNRAMQDLLAGREQVEAAKRAGGDANLRSPVTEPPLTLDEIIALVRQRGTTTIEYFSLPDRLLVWVIDPSGMGHADSTAIEAFSLPVTAREIREAAREFLGFVDRDRISKNDGSVREFTQLLRGLYGKLIEPIRDRLPKKDGQVLTIIPHAELFRIPFGALVAELPDDFPDSFEQSPRYLIQDYPIAYSPSIGVMRYTGKNREQAASVNKTDLVAFVDPTDIGYSGLSPFSEFPEGNSDPKVAEFCDHMRGSYNQDGKKELFFLGSEATPDNLRRSASAAGVLCFFTHAKAMEEKGKVEQSFIALSGTPFRLTDIYELDLVADLVILAACETGRGEITGDGVTGFSRAFTYAGAPSLMISLWEITVRETLRQLERFHRFYRRDGMSKVQALQQAQIKALTERPYQPNIWAGLALFGEI